MKLLSTMAAALLLASPALAVTWGGTVTAHYGFGTVSGDSDVDTVDGAYSEYGIAGSVGFGLGSAAIQLDAGYEIGTESGGGDYYDMTAYNVHLMFPVGQYTLGAFYGFGTGNHPYDGDYGDVTYYGVEAAMSSGKNDFAAQLGLATHRNSHSSLDYDNAFFVNGAMRHFVNDNFMIRGTAGMGNFLTHSDPGTALLLAIDATFALRGNLYATVGLREFNVVNAGEGNYNDLSAFVGITMAFGGSGSLRDSMLATPMIATMLPSLVAVASSAVD